MFSVLVSEGYLAPYIGFIKSGECHILRQVEVMHTLSSGKKVGLLCLHNFLDFIVVLLEVVVPVVVVKIDNLVSVCPVQFWMQGKSLSKALDTEYLCKSLNT